MKLKIKKGSTVQVIAGSDKGKTGKVLGIKLEPLKIQVQGVRMQTHFDKKDGLLKKEGWMDYSNVKLVSAPEAKTGGKKKAASKRA